MIDHEGALKGAGPLEKHYEQGGMKTRYVAIQIRCKQDMWPSQGGHKKQDV